MRKLYGVVASDRHQISKLEMLDAGFVLGVHGLLLEIELNPRDSFGIPVR